jgi:hypothetical protein
MNPRKRGQRAHRNAGLRFEDGPPWGRPVTAILVIAMAQVLVPAVANAGTAFLNVFISDPTNTGNKAHVDSAGSLQVAGAVHVEGTPSVRDADAPARETFQIEVGVDAADGETFLGPERFFVPSGKRLVIQDVAGLITVPSGELVLQVWVETATGGGPRLEHDLLPTFTGTHLGLDDFVVSRLTQLYADGGTEVDVQAARFGFSGEASGFVTISGYLVDCTSAACG